MTKDGQLQKDLGLISETLDQAIYELGVELKDKPQSLQGRKFYLRWNLVTLSIFSWVTVLFRTLLIETTRRERRADFTRN